MICILSTLAPIRIQEILTRLSKGKEVTLEERIYINKYASRNKNVSTSLQKGSHIQRKSIKSSSIEDLLNGVDLCSSEPYSTYNPDKDDLGEWFSESPSWVSRS